MRCATEHFDKTQAMTKMTMAINHSGLNGQKSD